MAADVPDGGQMRALAGRIAIKRDEKEPNGSFLYAQKGKNRKMLTTAQKLRIKEKSEKDEKEEGDAQRIRRKVIPYLIGVYP